MRYYISKVNKVTYGKYPFSLIITFEGKKKEMEFMKEEMEKEIKDFLGKSFYQWDNKEA